MREKAYSQEKDVYRCCNMAWLWKSKSVTLPTWNWKPSHTSCLFCREQRGPVNQVPLGLGIELADLKSISNRVGKTKILSIVESVIRKKRLQQSLSNLMGYFRLATDLFSLKNFSNWYFIAFSFFFDFFSLYLFLDISEKSQLGCYLMSGCQLLT